MAVQILNTGTFVEVTWDVDLVGGGHDNHRVNITATKPDGSEPSNRDALVNDGKATFTFPGRFDGDVHFKVEGPHGTDEATVTVAV